MASAMMPTMKSTVISSLLAPAGPGTGSRVIHHPLCFSASSFSIRRMIDMTHPYHEKHMPT
jgi:hypothetical protein